MPPPPRSAEICTRRGAGEDGNPGLYGRVPVGGFTMRIEGERHFLGGLETTRMGRIIGKDDAQKVIEVLARTCHIRFGSVKVGGKGKASPKGALNYNRRAGKYGPLKDGKLDELERKLAEARTARDEAARAGADNLEPHDKEIPRRERTLKKARDRDAKAAELEYEAGDHEAVLRAADLIAAGAGPRVDRFAERLLISQVAELPADSTPGQRKACAEALVKRWTDAGHPAHAAVHGNGCVQPHVHVLATARPIRRDGNGVEYADRSVRLWAGQHAKEAVQRERGLVVEIVNRTCPSEVLFHHGRHEDVGIDREAREAAGLLQRRLGRGQRTGPRATPSSPVSTRRGPGARPNGTRWRGTRGGRPRPPLRKGRPSAIASASPRLPSARRSGPGMRRGISPASRPGASRRRPPSR